MTSTGGTEDRISYASSQFPLADRPHGLVGPLLRLRAAKPLQQGAGRQFRSRRPRLLPSPQRGRPLRGCDERPAVEAAAGRKLPLHPRRRQAAIRGRSQSGVCRHRHPPGAGPEDEAAHRAQPAARWSRRGRGGPRGRPHPQDRRPKHAGHVAGRFLGADQGAGGHFGGDRSAASRRRAYGRSEHCPPRGPRGHRRGRVARARRPLELSPPYSPSPSGRGSG